MSKNISRLELNREVRRILVRHCIDTSKVNFSCHAKSMSLSGGLYKDGGGDLEPQTVEIIMQEFIRLGIRILCELDNWNVTDGSVTKKGGAKTGDKKNPENANSKDKLAPKPNPTKT